jgi:hypothetical protein
MRNLLTLMMALISTLAFAEGRAPIVQSLELAVLQPPVVVNVGGTRHLVYEVHISYLRAVDVVLTRIEVLSADRSARSLDDYRDVKLKEAVGRPEIGAGKRAIFYVWMPLNDATVPSAVMHRFEYDVVRAVEREHVVMQGPSVNVRNEKPLVLGAPLQGGRWVAVYGPTVDRGHRRFVYTVDGRSRIPARFAIDWMKLGDNNTFAHDAQSKLTNWYGYGANVLAVADAKVVDAKDDILEDATIASSPAPIALQNASGNYIALDLGGGRYAFYEHLKHGSIRVKVGDRVRRGDVIGLLGNTGSSSSGPHLHFHVSDANASLAAEGLPYVFDNFEAVAEFPKMEDVATGVAPQPLSKGSDGKRHGELPAPNTVVSF